MPDQIPQLVDQPLPPHGTWVAAVDPGTDGKRGSMTWQPDNLEFPDPRGPLYDQPHDEGVWEMGPGQVAIWRPAPTNPEGD